jgi:hypothetical protein
MLEIILGGITVSIVATIVTEIRVRAEKKEKEKLQEAISTKDKLIIDMTEKLNEGLSIIEDQSKLVENLRGGIKDLVDSSGKLVHDYHIIVKLLEDEIGEEESNRRYQEKKSEKPKDLNELIKEIQTRKEDK